MTTIKIKHLIKFYEFYIESIKNALVEKRGEYSRLKIEYESKFINKICDKKFKDIILTYDIVNSENEVCYAEELLGKLLYNELAYLSKIEWSHHTGLFYVYSKLNNLHLVD